MDKEELLQKLQEEKRLKWNAQRREAYLREKINVEMLEFDEEDNADFSVMFQKIPRENDHITIGFYFGRSKKRH